MEGMVLPGYSQGKRVANFNGRKHGPGSVIQHQRIAVARLQPAPLQHGQADKLAAPGHGAQSETAVAAVGMYNVQAIRAAGGCRSDVPCFRLLHAG